MLHPEGLVAALLTVRHWRWEAACD